MFTGPWKIFYMRQQGGLPFVICCQVAKQNVPTTVCRIIIQSFFAKKKKKDKLEDLSNNVSDIV